MIQRVLSLSSTYPLNTGVNTDSNQIIVDFLLQIEKHDNKRFEFLKWVRSLVFKWINSINLTSVNPDGIS